MVKKSQDEAGLPLEGAASEPHPADGGAATTEGALAADAVAGEPQGDATDPAPAAVEEPEGEPGADAESGDGEGDDEGDEPETAVAAEPKTGRRRTKEGPSLANPASLGLALLTHPGGATSTSYDGKTYEADKKGVFMVPLEAVDALVSHGFTVAA